MRKQILLCCLQVDLHVNITLSIMYFIANSFVLLLQSVIKICFHERRLQFMEREQMQQWQASRPGERIIEVDVPLSYGLCHVSQPLNPNFLNTVEIFWDPLKEVGVYIKVNCISTEFTPKKHGGEKGVPFRLQIETYIESTNPTGGTTTLAISAGALSIASASVSGGVVSAATPIGINISSGNNHSLVNGKQPVHAAACQIKVCGYRFNFVGLTFIHSYTLTCIFNNNVIYNLQTCTRLHILSIYCVI